MTIVKTTQQAGAQQIDIVIEVDGPAAGASPYQDLQNDAAKKIVESARDLFGEGLELARGCAARVVQNIDAMEEKLRPTEYGVQLAIKLDAQVGAILARMGTEAQLQVTMKWVSK